MISEKNLAALKLTEEQLKKYRELVQKEKMLRGVLRECGIHPTAIEKIIEKSDLDKVDQGKLGELAEEAKQTWSEFIIKKR